MEYKHVKYSFSVLVWVPKNQMPKMGLTMQRDLVGKMPAEGERSGSGEGRKSLQALVQV